ncbi:hypothetical protein PLESTF_000283000 [Pleodorina starrii]|nr:hypothetical protein PLESTM_001203000 [Pleodorina starrii]GLC65343.1 hypothetical protein PLESTF_000283000 [Pleodorina starrii]
MRPEGPPEGPESRSMSKTRPGKMTVLLPLVITASILIFFVILTTAGRLAGVNSRTGRKEIREQVNSGKQRRIDSLLPKSAGNQQPGPGTPMPPTGTGAYGANNETAGPSERGVMRQRSPGDEAGAQVGAHASPRPHKVPRRSVVLASPAQLDPSDSEDDDLIDIPEDLAAAAGAPPPPNPAPPPTQPRDPQAVPNTTTVQPSPAQAIAPGALLQASHTPPCVSPTMTQRPVNCTTSSSPSSSWRAGPARPCSKLAPVPLRSVEWPCRISLHRSPGMVQPPCLRRTRASLAISGGRSIAWCLVCIAPAIASPSP